MKKYFLPILYLAFTIPAWVYDYNEAGSVGFVAHSPGQHPVIIVNTASNLSPEITPGDWHTIDLSTDLPADTQAVFLSGILIITHGSTPEVCNMYISLREGGGQYGTDPTGQVVKQSIGDGARQNYFELVPVNDGKIDLLWSRSTEGEWPEHCSYGFNFKLVGYLR